MDANKRECKFRYPCLSVSIGGLKKEVKSTAKTTAGLDHYGCVPLAPYNLRRKRKEPRMNSDGRG